MAGCQVEPPSVDTSTPATTPPPVSAAVPVIVTFVPSVTFAPAAGDVIVEVGAVVSVDFVARTSPRQRRPGLRAHVGEQVQRRLLLRRVRRVAVGVGAVEAPRPLDRAGAEHQGAARRPVERQVVRRRPVRVRPRPEVRAASRRPRRWSTRRGTGPPAGSRCRGPRPTRSRASAAPAWRSHRWRGSRRPCCARGAGSCTSTGTVIAVEPLLTTNDVPVSAFSERPPSGGGRSAGRARCRSTRSGPSRRCRSACPCS